MNPDLARLQPYPFEKRRRLFAVIVKKVDAQTRSKTSINELLRD